MNQRQIDVIKKEVIPNEKLDTEHDSIGIITPYRNQTNELQCAFVGTRIKSDTIDKFQGRENDIIILSTVDNEVNEFSDNANRLNVAISRAIEQLVVVVSAADTKRDTNLGDLVRYIRYNNFKVIQSEIYSVFDYLYKSYAKKRVALLLKSKRISVYDSENIMFALIHKVLKDERFAKYDVTPHVSLRTILRDHSKLNDKEIRYAMNILTHVDFLIFNKLDKMPLLVVEVDGVNYHKDGTQQAERDKLKNAILEKYRLAYIRFKTNGSEEYKRLIGALEQAIEFECKRA
jgi:very-short-patch-repair endonuclease